MGKTELIPSLCGDTLNQQPVGDKGGSAGSLLSSWGRGIKPAVADRRNIEQKRRPEDGAH